MKILVVKLHALGDMVMATPAFRRLKEALPNVEYDLATTDWAFPAVRGLDFFREVAAPPADLFFGRGRGRAFGLAKLWLDLKRRGYDEVVIFHKSKKIIRFFSVSRSRAFAFADEPADRRIPLPEDCHSALSNLSLADAVVSILGGERHPEIDLGSIRYEWKVSEEERSEAQAILTGAGIAPGDRYAVLFPGGGSNPNAYEPERRWGAAGFGELAKWLHSGRGLRPLLLGSGADGQIAIEVQRLSGASALNLAGSCDIRIAAAVTSGARLAVSNDSAPLHISAAVGAPTLGIFGPTGALGKAPLGRDCASVSLGLPCSPCYFTVFKGCIYDRIRCLEELPVSRVIEAAASLLDRLPSERS